MQIFFMKKILFLFIMLCCSLFKVIAQKQGQPKIDSMLLELPKQKDDTNKVKLLKDISFNYSNTNPDDGLKYGQQSLELATKLDWKIGIGGANSRIGINYDKKSNYSKALEYYQKALKTFEEIGFKEGQAKILGGIAAFYVGEGGNHNYPTGLEYGIKSLNILEEIGNWESSCNVSYTIGNYYKVQYDYLHALEYYFKALKIAEKNGYKDGIRRSNYGIGDIYKTQNDFYKAMEYFQKNLKLSEEIGDKNGIAGSIMAIGTLYEKEKNYTKAMENIIKAKQIYEEISDKNGIFNVTGILSDIYKETQLYSKALENSFKYLQMAMDKNNKYGIASCIGEIGEIYLLMYIKSINNVWSKENFQNIGVPSEAIPKNKADCLEIAIDYLHRGLKLSTELNFPDFIKDCDENLTKAYKLKGNYMKAFETYQNFIVLKDSASSLENNKKILKMGMEEEYKRKRLTDSLKTQEMQKIEAIKLQRQKSYTYIGIAGVILLLSFSFFIVKERRKSEKLLLNILPVEVAEELKSKGSADAKLINEVTVLFTDFKGFTQLSEKLSPQALVAEINDCFSAFDHIMQKYGVEKIKTIGDAYMAAGGLPTPNKTHADDVVKAAVDIQAFMSKHKADKVAKNELYFDIRIGIHTGPVVAGIVGVKKFQYDIWGDTVNTASRMESSGEVGKVNISGTTYELVKDRFNCIYRGMVAAKGKGEIAMYFVG